jgi:hypothetical protein
MTAGSRFRPGPNGYPTNGLRDDPRQWLIYGDAQQAALIRGVEIMGLQMVGRHLSGNPIREVRAIGHMMLNLADARIRTALKEQNYHTTVVEYLAKVMTFAAGQAPPPPPQILDELHALVYQTDHRARSAGIGGEGALRSLVRGD